ncbi:putative neutral ceramidase C isoform X3 [Anas acuta]|uniref:putative neutral ceramidase C isoform X3 n=1 Tax=Anas acuta TaxID=28680 RepID=UPI0035C88F1F
MCGKRHKCSFSRLEVVLIVLLAVMIAVTVALLVLHFLTQENSSSNGNDDPLPTQKPTNGVSGGYLLGAGRADCTGPVAEIPLMGYANPDQVGGGLLTRLYSRAFIVAEPNSSKRVVFVSIDIGMVSQRLRLEVLKKLKSKYGELYRQDNVILSGTHTHSGPGGYFQYTLFWFTSKGLIKPSLDAIVKGIVKSIDIAHQNLKRGRLFINRGTVENSQINRSPYSYLQNPAYERSRYSSNTDKEMVILKMVDENGHDLGVISWFAVHPVSMNNTNRLVNSDNVGYASLLFEQEKNKGMLTGEGSFVAAFASSNLGDVSPNTKGPFCVNTGESCDNPQSTCPVGGAAMCMAMGPGTDMFDSTRIIGQNIYSKAKELYANASQEITGPLSSAHQWVNMSDVQVELNATHTVRVKTCKPALGYSFAAGTIDGVGAFNFTQGSVEGDPFWDQIRDQLLGKPSNETKACHEPKPVLFSTGEMTWPHPWHPDIVDVQIATIGSLAIVAVPGEFTTMSGRRLREAVKSEFDSHGTAGMDVVIAGLCNVYTHYITTYEEYQVQRYEAASTIYGPHTLSAYLQLYRGLARAIATNTVQDLPSGPEPPFFNITNFTLVPAVTSDRTPVNKKFGDVLQEVRQHYRVGEVAKVTFVSANPRNSAENMTEHNFLTVETYVNGSGKWQVVRNDASWDTRFYWTKGSLGRSNATIEWHIPNDTEPGIYRIRYFGHSKKIGTTLMTINPFKGVSSTFEITSL